jgi:20S proteasome subunit beta 2
MLRNYEMPVSRSLTCSDLDFIRITDLGMPIISLVYISQNERGEKSRQYKFRRGTTAWTKEDVRSLVVSETVTPIEAMDMS